MLWLCGRPGCGKSVLTSNVLLHLRDRRKRAEASAPTVVYAFGDKQDGGKKTSASLLRTVIWQILCSDSISVTQKLEIINDCRRTARRDAVQPMTVDDHGFPYLSSLLRKYTQMIAVVIMIDGLDECYDPELLGSLVAQPSSFDASTVKIWISSQKTSAISSHLEQSSAKIDMEDENVRNLTNQDIRQYIRAELSHSDNDTVCQNVDELTDILASKANGMFLWAALSVPEVRATTDVMSTNFENIKQCIIDLPRGLEKIFVYLLKRILSPQGARADYQHRNSLLRILRWSFHAIRPLTIDELEEAMTIVPYGGEEAQNIAPTPSLKVSGLLKLLYPMIYVSKDTVHLMHASFRDFILPAAHTDRLTGVFEDIGAQRFQSELASQCVVYLSRHCFKDFISLSRNSNATERFAFFSYANANWIPHTLNDVELNTQLKSQLSRFLSTNQAITWLERYMAQSHTDLMALQSQLYHHQSYVTDPKWILKILVDSVEERMDSDPHSDKTYQMTSELGGFYKYHGMAKEAVAIYERLYQTQKALADPNGSRLRYALNSLAMAKSDLHQLDEAQQLYNELLNILRSQPEEDPESIATALGNLATNHARLGNHVVAAELFAEVLHTRRASHGEHDVRTCLAYNNFGHACLKLGRTGLAKENCLKALQLYTEVQGKDSRGVLLATCNLAAAENASGNVEEALRLSRYVWTTRQALLGEDHPDTNIACNNYSNNLCGANRFDEALPLLENSLRIRRKLSGWEDPSALTVQSNFADALLSVGRYKEAIDLARRTFETRQRSLGTAHPDTLLSMQIYANALRKDYRYEGAKPLLVECFKRRSEAFGLYHESTLTAMTDLSTCCIESYQYKLGKHLATRVLKLTKIVCPEDHPATLRSEVFHAVMLRDLGYYEEAANALKRFFRLARRASPPLVELEVFSLQAKVALSSTYRLDGKYESALEAVEEVIAACEPHRIDHDSKKEVLLAGLEQRSLALEELGQHQEMLDLMKRVVEERVTWFGSKGRAWLHAQCVLARAHVSLGDLEAAHHLIRPVLEVCMAELGTSHKITATAMSVQARCYSELGRYTEAASLQLEAIEIRRTLLGSRHVLTLTLRHHYARMLFMAGDSQGAEEAMMDVFQDERRYLREGHPHIVESAMYLDRIRAEKGQSPMRLSITASQESGHDIDHPTDVQTLLQTLEEAKAVLGSESIEVLVIMRELALAREAAGEKHAAIPLMEEVLERLIEQSSNAHLETITTLIESMRMTGDRERVRNPPFSRIITTMIRDRTHRDLNLFRTLLEYDPDLLTADPETGYTALALAVHRNELDLVQCLLACGTDPNMVETESKTCLHIAVEAQLPDMVKLLLEHGAKPNVLGKKTKCSPLYLASVKGHVDIARNLLQASADPNLPEAVPPLFAAAGYNRSDVVRLLLECGANLEFRSSSGMTPFLNSIFHQHYPMVELLHKQGADMSARANNGMGPLHLACLKGSKLIINFLLKIGQDVNESTSQTGFRPIHIAAEAGLWEVMEVLIQAGASLDSRNTNHAAFTPLVTAAWHGHVNVVDEILKLPDQTPDIETGLFRVTALHYAAYRGNTEVVDRLIAAGADVNKLTDRGTTPLIEAVAKGNLTVTKRLLAADADIDVVCDGMTVLLSSILNRNVEILEAIIQHPKTNVDQRIGGAMPLLSVAMYSMPSSTVKLLLKRGANPNTKNRDLEADYPLHFAVQLREPDCVRMLLDHNADQSLKDTFGQTAVDMVEGDDASLAALLDKSYKSERSENIANNAQSTITRLTQEILAHLESDGARTDKFVRRRLNTMYSGFVILNAIDDARIACEQNIVLKERGGGDEKNETVVFQHDLACLGCRAFSDMVGTIYICTKCIQTALCEPCFEKQKSPGTRCKPCRHDGTSYRKVPRDGWVEMNREGFVKMDEETGIGIDFKKWLAAAGGAKPARLVFR